MLNAYLPDHHAQNNDRRLLKEIMGETMAHTCPNCGDEENYQIKTDGNGEYFKCKGCGHCYDENFDDVDEDDDNTVLR